jgi:hypothetical protein
MGRKKDCQNAICTSSISGQDRKDSILAMVEMCVKDLECTIDLDGENQVFPKKNPYQCKIEVLWPGRSGQNLLEMALASR